MCLQWAFDWFRDFAFVGKLGPARCLPLKLPGAVELLQIKRSNQPARLLLERRLP